MLTKEESKAIDLIMAAVRDGLGAVENNTALSAIQAASISGGPVTALPSRYRITSPLVEALRLRIDEENAIMSEAEAEALAEGLTMRSVSPEEMADELFEDLKHGTETHQAWLRSALLAHFKDEPIPASDAPVVPSTPEQIITLLGLIEDQAVELIDAYFDVFPGARGYFNLAAPDSIEQPAKVGKGGK